MDNLLSNGVKYAPEGSVVDVVLEEKRGRRLFSVSNPVARPVDTEKIFRKYYREEEGSLGFGLGLDLVRSICRRHDIGLEAACADGRFTITLDLTEVA